MFMFDLDFTNYQTVPNTGLIADELQLFEIPRDFSLRIQKSTL